MILWTSGPAKPERNFEIIRLLERGCSTKWVAEKFRVTQGRVRQLRAYYEKHTGKKICLRN